MALISLRAPDEQKSMRGPGFGKFKKYRLRVGDTIARKNAYLMEARRKVQQ